MPLLRHKGLDLLGEPVGIAETEHKGKARKGCNAEEVVAGIHMPA